MCLTEAADAIRDASAVCVIKNRLLADKLTDHQQLLVDMPSGGQKAATTSDQGVNAHQIPPQVAKLLLDGFADLVDTGLLLLGNGKKLLRHVIAICTRPVAKVFHNPMIPRMDQDLGHIAGFIE